MTNPLHPRPKPLRRRGAARVIAEALPSRPGSDMVLVEHPDGWYWIAPDGHQQFGPFASAEVARADRDLGLEGAPEVGETVQEAEAEIGIADWIDPDTGAPAEGPAPRIDDER